MDILKKLHNKLGSTLLTKLESGKINASELNVIRQFLKDNGYDAEGLVGQNTPDRPLTAALPFDTESDRTVN